MLISIKHALFVNHYIIFFFNTKVNEEIVQDSNKKRKPENVLLFSGSLKPKPKLNYEKFIIIHLLIILQMMCRKFHNIDY